MNDSGAEKADQLLRQGSAQLGITLSEQAIAGLVTYSLELIKWNRKVNLVAKNTSLDDLVEKHLLDSLTLVPVLDAHPPNNGRLLDVGSGAGFPGLVIKIANSKRPVVLLEPRQRRVSFLNHIIRILAVSAIQVIPHRTDEKDALPNARYAVITSRAVADVTSFLTMVQDLAEPGTLVICMQGTSGKEQWEGEKDNPRFEGVSILHIRLPFSQADRFILVFEKKP